MGKHKRGFTLIEVLIFLAITALLFLSVTIGVQNSIYQQRYNDAVQGFADFLGNIYSEVTNVQSNGNGRSDYAIYGKVAVFADSNGGDEQSIYVYNTVGKAFSKSEMERADSLQLLKNMALGVEIQKEDGSTTVGIVDTYVPRWGAKVQVVDGFKDFTGMVLIVRDPKTGTVRTFVNQDAVSKSEAESSAAVHNLLQSRLESGFKVVGVDFCVNPNGNSPSNARADVRLASGARNVSGVTIMSLDNGDNVCNRGSGV